MIDHAAARDIAVRWYSPRALGLVELATSRRRLSDTGLLRVIEETQREIDEVTRMNLTSTEDLDELDNLLAWANTKATARGLL